jgi:hypothetical protein
MNNFYDMYYLTIVGLVLWFTVNYLLIKVSTKA